MVRVNDYESRRKGVLNAVIELYLESAHPISSESLLETCSFDLSSATIRNVFKDLEERGYLTHPHTSAGRIPTDSGYRFYINDIINNLSLTQKEEETIEEFFNYYMDRGEDVFEIASRLLSNFTHYAGIVSRKEKNDVYYYGLSYLLEQPEFKDTDRLRLLFKALEEDRLLELLNLSTDNSTRVVIGDECRDCMGLDNCSLIIRECKKSKRKLAKLALLGPKRMAYRRVIPMIDYVCELIENEF